jgi:hypothetical protein
MEGYMNTHHYVGNINERTSEAENEPPKDIGSSDDREESICFHYLDFFRMFGNPTEPGPREIKNKEEVKEIPEVTGNSVDREEPINKDYLKMDSNLRTERAPSKTCRSNDTSDTDIKVTPKPMPSKK